jgi:hydroxyethylthiazole kinase-like uncharacterized protein yjeF
VSPEPVYRVAELRTLETRAAEAPLMERAGLAAAGVARDLLSGRSARALVLAGPGNNGGDAFVLARWLASWFFDVVVVFRGDAAGLPRDAAAAHDAWRAAGGKTLSEWPERGDFGLIVDGLFGIGLKRPAEGVHAKWISRASASGIPILALDVPSGLDADTGIAHAPTMRASATATFIALKPGLLTADGPDHCGEISVHALELDATALLQPQGYRLDWATLSMALPEVLKRTRRNVHKGSFGTLAIVGGSDGMVGAAILAARAGALLGAGKVWLGLAASARPAVDTLQPELMLREAQSVVADTPSAIVVGPGIGAADSARDLVRKALRLNVPAVVDADALNLIADDDSLAEALTSRSAPAAITPHPGEAGRLAGMTTAEVQADRLQTALKLADRFRAAVVLKGCGSIVALADGRFGINASGGAGLASGGTGDVLAGMIGAFLAQGVAMPDALKIAVCLHGAASDALVAAGVGPLGITASEIAPSARRLINAARG